jgi:tyrosine-protein kinase
MSFDRKPRNWYHGLLTRARAEEILKENGFGEGLFLVRESSSAAGDFVLSVVHDGSVIHYQVRRRGEDALFSLSEEKKVNLD